MKLAVIAILILTPLLVFAQEDITITTYYPSPNGVFRHLRLYPNDDVQAGDACARAGELSFRATGANANKMLYCDGATWQIFSGIPTGALMMFDTACPTGWTRITALDGRVLIAGASYALPPTSPPGGIPPMSYGTTYSASESTPVVGTGGGGGGWSAVDAATRMHEHSFPYATIVLCKKN